MARGALEGLERSMYKRTNWVVNDSCLGNSTVNSSLEVYNIFVTQTSNKNFLEVLRVLLTLKHETDVYC